MTALIGFCIGLIVGAVLAIVYMALRVDRP